MNKQEATIAEAKRLLKVAPAGPPCFERDQMEYILSRFDGTAGAPFAHGAKPDTLDEVLLTNRLSVLNREVTRRNPKEAARGAA